MRAKFEELRILIHEYSPVCIALQETMIGYNKAPCPRDYSLFHTEYNAERGNHGGSALLIRKDISHVSIDLQTSLQAVAVQINLNRCYTICSIYLSPNENVSEGELLILCQQLPQPFFILGDVNGRHYMWGDTITNRRGDLLFSFIEDHNLGILNTGEPTHFHIQTGTFSRIDISLCSPTCLLDFTWQVDGDRHGSDHFPIILKNADEAPITRPPRWCTDKANWTLFRDLSYIDSDANDLPSVDDAVQLLNSVYYRAGHKAIPRTSGKFHRKPIPWWNLECRNAHRAMRAAFTRYRRHRCEHYIISFKKSRSRFRRIIKKARRESWMIFLSTISWKTSPSEVWIKMKKIAGKYIPRTPPVLNINGVKVADPKTVSEEFATHFAGVSKKNTRPPYNRYRIQEENNNLDFTTLKTEPYNLPFTMKELTSALSNCKDTSPGPDDIPYAMIKQSSHETKVFLLSIINRIWKESNFPTVWESGIMLPFNKPGKDPILPTNYRPVVLTSCVCKLMEKMVNVRLVWYLERFGYLTPSQCGFRHMRSCTDLLIRLESSICKAFACKQHHISVFFLLEKGL